MQTFQRSTKLTWLLAWTWWFVYVPFAVLQARLVWEKTWLTWTRGAQMIGFSLAHQYPEVVLLGALGGLGTALWVLVAVVLLLSRRHTLLTVGKVQLALSVFTLAVAFLPIDDWVLRFR